MRKFLMLLLLSVSVVASPMTLASSTDSGSPSHSPTVQGVNVIEHTTIKGAEVAAITLPYDHFKWRTRKAGLSFYIVA